jgi:hypothetical protein
MVDPFVPMRGTPGIRGRCDAAVARHHGFGSEEQMQGQMHVHVTEIALPVPLLGHFFCHHRRDFSQWSRPFPGREQPETADLFPFP